MPREVRVLAAMAFIAAVGFGIQSPAIPVFASALGAGSAAVGALISAFALMRLVTGPIGGKFVNSLGEIGVLVTGLALLALTSILAGFSQNYTQLLIMRGAGGIGSALYTVAAMAMLFRVTPQAITGRAVGVFQGAFSVGTIIGPALGGAMSGLSPRVPFFAYGVAAGIGGVIGFALLRRTGRVDPIQEEPGVGGAQQEDTRGRSIREAVRLHSYRTAVFCNFSLGWAVYGVRVSIVPLFLLDVVGSTAVWIGIGLTVCAVAQALSLQVAGRLADVWPSRRTLVLGEGAVILGFLSIMVGATLPGYLVGLAVLGLGAAFVSTGGAKVVSQVAGRSGGGMVIAVHQSGADAGMVAGPLVAGALVQIFGYTVGLTATAGIALVGMVLAFLIRPRPVACEYDETGACRARSGSGV